MSVIARQLPSSGSNNLTVFVKGAPETIEKLCVPSTGKRYCVTKQAFFNLFLHGCSSRRLWWRASSANSARLQSLSTCPQVHSHAVAQSWKSKTVGSMILLNIKYIGCFIYSMFIDILWSVTWNLMACWWCRTNWKTKLLLLFSPSSRLQLDLSWWLVSCSWQLSNLTMGELGIQ